MRGACAVASLPVSAAPGSQPMETFHEETKATPMSTSTPAQPTPTKKKDHGSGGVLTMLGSDMPVYAAVFFILLGVYLKFFS